MRLYYETLEVVSNSVDESEFVRVDITDMTELEKGEVLKAIKDIMAGMNYKLTEHECYHDQLELQKPCEMQEIK